MKQSQSRGVSPADVKKLPTSPGVYIMRDARGKVLYVGKAANLRSRVKTYFSGGDGRPAVPYLVRHVTSIEPVVTLDERMALRLEADFIKKFKPRYNIRLKDDKAYLLVRIDRTHEWPRLELVRRRYDDGADYIGPFVFSYELRSALEAIRRALPLRSCSDRVLYNRVRPCLEYQIKRCAGPCCLSVDKAQYDEWARQAIDILQGKSDKVVQALEADMLRASEDLRFEDAARLRDQIDVVRRLSHDRVTAGEGQETLDVFGLYREGERGALSVLAVRDGRIAETKSFMLDELSMSDREVIRGSLFEYYNNDISVPLVMVSHLPDDAGLIEEYLREQRGGAVSLTTPQRGEKKKLLELAIENAFEHFRAQRSEVQRTEVALQELHQALGLDQEPRVVDCVDISHFQGGETVGVVVRFTDGHPDRAQYRKYILSQEGKPDDFASMRETVERHLRRALDEGQLPDLMVIDGGKAQLDSAARGRAAAGLQRPAMIGLAKRRTVSRVPRRVPVAAHGAVLKMPERIYQEGESEPLVLRGTSDALHLLERIRDETHRTAVTFHRSRRTKRTLTSVLDAVPGISPARRTALLREFGSVKAMLAHEPEEIAERTGIPRAVAARVVERLRASPEDSNDT